MKMWLVFTVACLCLVAAGMQAAETEGTFVHQPSGMTFPGAVGDFQRTELILYDDVALGVSANYNLVRPKGPFTASVYVYPSPPITSTGSSRAAVAEAKGQFCVQQFMQAQDEIIAVYPSAAATDGGVVPSPDPELVELGLYATFQLEAFLDGRWQRFRSVLYVFCYVGGDWTIKYRFSAPTSIDSPPIIADFMATLPWTITASP